MANKRLVLQDKCRSIETFRAGVLRVYFIKNVAACRILCVQVCEGFDLPDLTCGDEFLFVVGVLVKKILEVVCEELRLNEDSKPVMMCYLYTTISSNFPYFERVVHRSRNQVFPVR